MLGVSLLNLVYLYILFPYVKRPSFPFYFSLKILPVMVILSSVLLFIFISEMIPYSFIFSYFLSFIITLFKTPFFPNQLISEFI